MKRIFLGAVLSLFAMVQSFAWYINIGDGIIYETTGETTCKVTSNSGVSGNIKLPETVIYEGKTYKVTSIEKSAFYGSPSLKSITIPNSVDSIGNGAFSKCTGLVSVDLGKSVTSIGGGAFKDCSSLTSIAIPKSVTFMGDNAFDYRYLESVYVFWDTPPHRRSATADRWFGEILSIRTIPATLFVPYGMKDIYVNFYNGKFTNIQEFESQCYSDEMSNDVIWYTGENGLKILPNANAFGANIVSNTYENGKVSSGLIKKLRISEIMHSNIAPA